MNSKHNMLIPVLRKFVDNFLEESLETRVSVILSLSNFLKETKFQKIFVESEGVFKLTEFLDWGFDSYSLLVENQNRQIINGLLTLCQRLASNESYRSSLIAAKSHEKLFKMLYVPDVDILKGALYCLISLAEGTASKLVLAETCHVNQVLHIIEHYDPLSRKLAASVLRLLSGCQNVQDLVILFNGIPVLLSQFEGENYRLQWHIAWSLAQLAMEPKLRTQIYRKGGLPILLGVLRLDHSIKMIKIPEKLKKEAVTPVSKNEHICSTLTSSEEQLASLLALKAAICATLTELTYDDQLSCKLAQEEAVYLLIQHVVPPSGDILPDLTDEPQAVQEAFSNLQLLALRAMRFLFSLERNRRWFHRLFPPAIFETFISVNHYKRDLSLYRCCVDRLNNITAEELKTVSLAVDNLNKQRCPLFKVGGYLVLDLLGSGAFGSVFKVQPSEESTASYLAVKEVSLHHPWLGRALTENSASVGEIVSEVNIAREQLRHPNIVQYQKVFIENEKLYIVMDLIEGLSLNEVINSMKEKEETFLEERIWKVLIQLIQGLHYLHVDKHVIHRDLTPNNILLGDRDRLTITDFGLARRKFSRESNVTSVVGTMLYCCPEIVQHKPYGERADIWSLGCVIYLLCTLHPPFWSQNLLALASKIVKGQYDPISSSQFCDKLVNIIESCLIVDSDRRPDISTVASLAASQLVATIDTLSTEQRILERKLQLEKEKRKSLKDKVKKQVPLNFPQSHPTDSFPLNKHAKAGSSFSLSLSPRKLQETKDPVLPLFQQLHKLIYISQLPPPETPCHHRWMLQVYTRMLFANNLGTLYLKTEMSKLMHLSKENIQLKTCPKYKEQIELFSPLEEDSVITTTYEELHHMIEALLLETEYYQC
ncbi:serine/threonine-protein kinase Nek10-like isoform X3 [Limulus polyphemus]|uniref:Serine/threonine-protein kinase Nek10-like isoform X3 n=1 Tax=Limulus polyphemus TaxID=6850 RepID=A0ABM1SIV1_LIMPO|nr:serine/threonine-protein kinase Nek10-like isoform X3 [Limulus polyphemus]